MSKAEDYLDGLLDSMEGQAQMEESDVMFSEDLDSIVGGESAASEQNFLDSFEQEFLSGQDADAFIREFEQELDLEDLHHDPEDSSHGEELLFENLDEIVNSAKSQAHDQDDISIEDSGMDLMIDTIGDVSMGDTKAKASGSEEMSMTHGMEPEEKIHTEEVSGLVDEDQDLMDLLQSEGDFSDIGDMLKADEDNIGLSDGGDAFADFSFDELEQGVSEDAAEPIEEGEGSGGKKRKKGKKQAKDENAGFVKKISQLLFGDDEEDESQKAAEPVKTPVTVAPNIEDLSDENLEILQALEGGMQSEESQASAEPEEDPEAKKKRLKEEKKAKAMAEKQAKKEQAKKAKAEKQAKKQQAKKAKPPKEPDNTPPLPKKPVILIFVMVGSFMLFVLLGTNLFGYSSCFERAETEFELGHYEAAFEAVYGLEVKDVDVETYDKYRILSYVDGEYNAYQTFMESGIYDMALDSLVRVVGRCDKYEAEAESYGCVQEMQKVKEKAVGALGSFGVSEDRARELCAMEDRTAYSKELYAILTAAGFSMD